MTIKDVLTAQGIESTPALEKALQAHITETVKAAVEEQLADRLAEQGKDMIPKERFSEVNEAKKALKAQVVALEKERDELAANLAKVEPQVKEIEGLRTQVRAQVTREWESRAKLLDEKVPAGIKTRIDRFRDKLVLPSAGKTLTDAEIQANLKLFADAELFGGPFDAAPPVGTPPRDGAPPVATSTTAPGGFSAMVEKAFGKTQ